ncbi:unnamed protein product, partial [Brachionus calyciflorus]
SNQHFNIELDTNSVPRYSCAAHKLNLAVRSGIKKSKKFSYILAKLSKFASEIRRSNIKSLSFIENKAKLRCENGTRWSSSYLMLESFLKAYEKKAFSDEKAFEKQDKPCPVSQRTILSYLKILNPLYTLSLLTQKADWHIGDVIQGLIFIFDSLDESTELGEKKQLILNLKNEIRIRFKFILESKIYILAATFNVSKLNFLYGSEDFNELSDKAVNETPFFFY